MDKWKRITILLIVGWIIATYLVISPFRCGERTTFEASKLQEKLNLDLVQLEKLRQQKQNTKLNRLLHDHGPSKQYEILRRKIYSTTKELWYFIGYQLGRSPDEDLKPDQIQVFLREVAERKKALLSNQEKLPALDGYEAWRCHEAASVSDIVQRRLNYLQHPRDCRAARKLNCGFGCQLHHLAYCLIFAYATERTLILNSKGWRYSNGWNDAFYPLSDTCNSTYDDIVWQYSGTRITETMQRYFTLDSQKVLLLIAKGKALHGLVTQKAKVVSLPLLYFLSPKPHFLPLTIPEDLADRIVQFNGDPSSWWIAQIIKYILKPRKHIQKLINDTIASMNFKSPIVGVHIRRTDKVDTEAEYYDIDEYMSHVEDYYAQLELTEVVDQRRVYLATDDAKVLEDARQKFPQYMFYGDPYRAKTAATHRRYKPPALANLLVDLHLLGISDYLVCTFSSQFCLLAYEMMQANRADASSSFYSLDDMYHFVGQNPHSRIIVPNGNNPALQVFHEMNSTGLRTGFHRRKKSMKSGLIPWYKTMDHVEVYAFPEYQQELRGRTTWSQPLIH